MFHFFDLAPSLLHIHIHSTHIHSTHTHTAHTHTHLKCLSVSDSVDRVMQWTKPSRSKRCTYPSAGFAPSTPTARRNRPNESEFRMRDVVDDDASLGRSAVKERWLTFLDISVRVTLNTAFT